MYDLQTPLAHKAKPSGYPFFLAFFSARFSFIVLDGFFLVSLRES